MPSFEGRFNHAIYLDWELKVEQIFSSNNLSEYEKVKSTTRAFIGFASIWWGVHIKKNIDNQPTSWKDLKDVMRNKFVPPYYHRELLRKLEQLKQGSNTMLTTKSSNHICIIVT